MASKKKSNRSIKHKNKNETIQQKLRRATGLHNKGNLEEAGKIYREILKKDPENPDALNLSGLIAFERQDLDSARKLISRAIERFPQMPSFYFNLSRVLSQGKDLQGALRNLNQALALKPDYHEAHIELGNLQRQLGNQEEAIQHYREVLKVNPEHSDSLHNMANALHDLGRFEEALTNYRKVLELVPDSATAWLNIGNNYLKMGKLEEALQSSEKAISLKPDYADPYNNIGYALQQTGNLSGSLPYLEKAINFKPDSSPILLNIGNAYKDMGQFDRAIEYYRQALAHNPRYPEAHSNILFSMNYGEKYDSATMYREACQWWLQQADHLERPEQYDNIPDPNRPLRIGFLSPDFKNHSVSFFFISLLRGHDSKTCEIFCYADVSRPDKTTEKLKHHSDHWRFIYGLTDEAVVRQILTDQIDILIDLAGHTAQNRLLIFARKPAPIQLSWLGYPNTTGLATIDYRLTDAIADPGGRTDPYYSEKLVRLPHGFLCYTPSEEAPPVRSLPCLAEGRITFGSFNNPTKISLNCIRIWAEILQRVPNSRLMLKGTTLADPQCRENLIEAFGRNGIQTDRLLLQQRTASLAEHLDLYSKIDIGLDPFPYNGTTTTFEALWQGVPVVTLTGDKHAGRVGTSIMQHCGLDQLIAEDPEKYIQLAVELAGDWDRLARLRSGSREQLLKSPLCNYEGFSRDMEETLRRIWQAWCSPMEDVEVEDKRPHHPDEATGAAIDTTSKGLEYNRKGEECFTNGQIQAARIHFQKAIETDPNCSLAYNNLGVLCFQEGEPQEALTHFRRSLEIEPQSLTTLDNVNAVLEHIQGIGSSSSASGTETIQEESASEHEHGTESGIPNKDIAARQGAVWIASYPKSGNTWVRFIVAGLLGSDLADSGVIEEKVPDIHKCRSLEKLKDKRFIKTHWGYQRCKSLLPTAAAIYIVRNPLDVLASNLNYLGLYEPKDIEAAVQEFAAHGGLLRWKQFAIPSWEDHISDWLQAKQEIPILWIRYEDMLADPVGHVQKMAHFLGLSPTTEEIRRVVQATSFESLKTIESKERGGENKTFFQQEVEGKGNSTFHFMHKGKFGGYRDVLTAEQIEALLSRFQPILHKLDYQRNDFLNPSPENHQGIKTDSLSKQSVQGANHYKDNLSLLQKYHPKAYQQLIETPPSLPNRLETMPEGWINGFIEIEGQLLPLHQDKEKEIAPTLQKIGAEDTTVICFIGMGLGYPALEIVRNRPRVQKIIIFEPFLPAFTMALQANNLRDLLSDPRLIIHLGHSEPLDQEILAPAVQALQVEDSYIYSHQPSLNMAHQLYDKVRKQVYAFCSALNISGATIGLRGHLHVKNRFANLTCLSRAFLVDDLKGIYENQPAILVTAGPSLDKNIHLLQGMEDAVCIICTDSAFPALQQNNITPHFVTSLDPQDILFEKMSQCLEQAAQSNLLCQCPVTPKITKYFPFKNIFFAFNASNMESWLNDLLGGKVTITNADSNAQLNLLAALVMKASPIMFIGYDLAYTDNKMHSSRAVLTGDLPDMEHEQPESNPDQCWITSIKGEKVLTTRGFLNQQQQFARIINEHQGFRFLNTTEDGAGIPGTENVSLKMALEKFCQDNFSPEEILDKQLSGKSPLDSKGLQENFQGTLKEIKSLKQEADAAKKLTGDLVRKIQGCSRPQSLADLPQSIQGQLKRHDQLNKKIARAEHIWQILDELTINSLKTSNRMLTEIQLLSNRPNTYQQWLEKVIARSHYINEARGEALQTFINYLSDTISYFKRQKNVSNVKEKIELHMDVDNIHQAKILCQRALAEDAKQPKIHLYLGCIAVKQANPEEAVYHFDKALAQDPSLEKNVEKLKRETLEEYYTFLERLANVNQITDISKVFPIITLRQLHFWGTVDLPPEAIARQFPDSEEKVRKVLTDAHREYARELTEQNKLQKASQQLELAIKYSPQDADLRISNVQICFDLGDFDTGIAHLNEAIRLDPEKAIHWEEIGDALFKDGLWDEAAAAYEKCFLVLPSNITTLKKIGDSLYAAGKLEAAKEAYHNYKNKLVATDDPGGKRQ